MKKLFPLRALPALSDDDQRDHRIRPRLRAKTTIAHDVDNVISLLSLGVLLSLPPTLSLSLSLSVLLATRRHTDLDRAYSDSRSTRLRLPAASEPTCTVVYVAGPLPFLTTTLSLSLSLLPARGAGRYSRTARTNTRGPIPYVAIVAHGSSLCHAKINKMAASAATRLRGCARFSAVSRTYTHICTARQSYARAIRPPNTASSANKLNSYRSSTESTRLRYTRGGGPSGAEMVEIISTLKITFKLPFFRL